jgi:transcription termination factor Rho
MTNELSNVGFGDVSLKDHKELHWLTLQTIGVGRTQRHSFIAPPKGTKKTKLREWLAEQFVSYNDEELELWILLNGVEGVKDLAEQCNLAHKEIESLVKELKN